MSEKFKKLIEHFTRLPGIGPRQAARLAIAVGTWAQTDLTSFADSLQNIKSGYHLCQQCFNFADEELCSICKNPKRDRSTIAVVERVTDLLGMERSGVYGGLYHVLGGAINPAGGVLPEHLRIPELVSRAQAAQSENKPLEIILATNPTTYGETTALYIEDQLRPVGVTTTRLARGLQAGASVEYADETTLASALKHRK
jgi:recombination protein RecR